jgi:hypothetical protein
VGPQDRSGLVRKILPSPGFDPRTVQPVASRYTGPHSESDAERTVLRKLPEKDAFEGRSRQTDDGLKNRVCKMHANGTQRKLRELLQIPLSPLIL